MQQLIRKTFQLLKKLFLAGTAGVSLACGYLIYNQEMIILPSVASQGTVAPVPADVESEIIKTSDGESLLLWHQKPKSDNPSWAMLIFHGNGDTVWSSLVLQRFFSESGFSTFAIDYRGTGGSTGSVSEEGLYRDAEALYEHVAERFNPKSIVILGQSFGTGIASYLASKHHSPALVLISPYLSIPKVGLDRKPLALLTPFLRYEIPTERYLRELKDSCVVIAHGELDRTILAHHSRELTVSETNRVRMTKIFEKDVGHGDIFHIAQVKILDTLNGCLN